MSLTASDEMINYTLYKTQDGFKRLGGTHCNLLIQHNNEKIKRFGRQVTLGIVSCPPAAAAVMSLPPAGIK